MNVQGAILCGGRSSRFGSDKALAPLLQNNVPAVVSLHSLLVALKLNPVLLSDDKNRYASYGLDGVEDIFKNCGPLSGIHSGLSQTEASALLLLTVDMPLIAKSDLQTLLATYHKNKLPSFFTINQQLVPFPGIYTKCMLPQIHDALQNNTFSMQELLNKTKLKNQISHNSAEHFSNINTHQDWCDLKISVHEPKGECK